MIEIGIEGADGRGVKSLGGGPILGRHRFGEVSLMDRRLLDYLTCGRERCGGIQHDLSFFGRTHQAPRFAASPCERNLAGNEAMARSRALPEVESANGLGGFGPSPSPP